METQTDEILPSPLYRRAFSQPKSVDPLDFEEDNPMFTTAKMFRRPLSTPTIDRHVSDRPSSTDESNSEQQIQSRRWERRGHEDYIPVPNAGGGGMGTDSINRGRVARPQRDDETNEQYVARMERNKKAREKASEDRRNRNN